MADMTRRVRWLAFAALAGFVLVGLAIRLPRDPALAALAAALSLGAGLLLVRARGPAVLAGAALAAGGVAILGSGSAGNVGWFALCVLAAWTALAGGRSLGLTFWSAALVLFGGEAWFHHDPGWGAWGAGTTFSTLAALLVLHERSLVDQLRAAQADLAERTRAEERGRIMRELHDVIAHTLTVSLLHVASARLAVEHDPADAARALEEAERLGRQSLSEVRSIIGTSRSETGPAIAAPVPGIDGVGELVDQFRRAGADISVSVEGDLTQVQATTGAIAYRIAQESLTNAAKHAPGSPVAVRLLARTRIVEITVDSAGAPGSGAGLGVLSMGERAQPVGGHCDVGPHGGGWRVHATLPVRSPPKRAKR